MLYVSQYGNIWYASTVGELCEKLGYSVKSARRMYRDKKNGSSVHVGYVIGGFWLTAYVPYEGKA